jgi:hypothetical protein
MRTKGGPWVGAKIVLGVAGAHVELARGLGRLLEQEVRVEPDEGILHLAAGGAEEVERAGMVELDPDLGHQPPPAPLDRLKRPLGEDLEPRHLVAEHVLPPTCRIANRCCRYYQRGVGSPP